ncbi:hypothetical protein NECAME_16965 [Necator americanus]|uniref:Uncharacterized protein n=1 Tax=Necator americanus TaxID=51031 RepID=W2TUZ0_NECAM|nr:hypothetical protein NECAME_16965 [Necator americanus]ETN84881.1 hypothetical protein NECAME_16965 [Necator americanus]
MCRIYILLISVFVIRVAAFFPFFQGTGFIPPLPFFQRIPWEGIVQMRTILSDHSLTHGNYDAALERWAEEYGLTGSLKL